jgi:KaiC/GvpD/RAD55 family RecA-like ATPase
MTGIPGLDELIEGGFPRHRSILVCGDTGTGKTIFGLQFLVEGAAHGEPGVLVTVDEKPQHVLEEARRFGWDLESASESRRVTLLDASPFFTDARGRSGLDARQVASDLVRQVRRVDAQRLVIDSLTSLIPDAASPEREHDFFRSLLFSLDDNLGCTLVLTARTFAGGSPSDVCRTAELFASGIVDLRIGPVGERVVTDADGIRRVPIIGRSLSIRKMRGTRAELLERPFDILDGRGLVLRESESER